MKYFRNRVSLEDCAAWENTADTFSSVSRIQLCISMFTHGRFDIIRRTEIDREIVSSGQAKLAKNGYQRF